MIALIPARGGSKGLPGKNVKLLAGKPLIAHTIETALSSKLISEVIVSTDDVTIANVAKKFGATVPFMRPDILSSDTALSIDVYSYTLNRLSEERNINIQEIIILQPTSPLRTVQDIDDSINLFRKNKADSVISFVEEEHPIYWHKFIDKDGKIEDLFKNTMNSNRQELGKTFYPNGSIYVLKREVIKNRNLYTSKTFAYKMSRSKSIDIDTIEDFEFAEYLINK